MGAQKFGERYRLAWRRGAALATGLLWIAFGAAVCFGHEAYARPPQDQKDSGDEKGGSSTDAATVKLRITVLSDHEKPIANASVYVRYNESGGFLHHDKLAELNFKTNQDGGVKVPEIPQGKIMIQVIATGWHTYGKWYDVDKNEETITIRLDPPPHWY